MIFYGQNSFKQTRDTLRFVTDPNATDCDMSDMLRKYLKSGLAPLVAKTYLVEGLSITMKTEETSNSVRVSNQLNNFLNPRFNSTFDNF